MTPIYLVMKVKAVSRNMTAIAMERENQMIVKRLSVPVGLEELIEGLTKEVLRKQPNDVYTFASEHFSQLLTLRDGFNEGK